MAAIFERFRDNSGRYRFQLETAAGEVIALSRRVPDTCERQRRDRRDTPPRRAVHRAAPCRSILG